MLLFTPLNASGLHDRTDDIYLLANSSMDCPLGNDLEWLRHRLGLQAKDFPLRAARIGEAF